MIPMCRLAMITACLVAVLTHDRLVLAQHIAVQEPIFETFGVGTTVSVPDRGRASLGGVSRSASSRSTYGFGPFRSANLGLSQSSSNVSVGVYIHDLDAMDKQVSGEARKRTGRSAGRAAEPGSAEYAYETLRSATMPEKRDLSGSGISAAAKSKSTLQAAASGPSADRLMKLAREAESKGKRGLALAYLRGARDAGSKAARDEIDRLAAAK
jgi:hypothetical protein